jgi:hypothetical protein
MPPLRPKTLLLACLLVGAPLLALGCGADDRRAVNDGGASTAVTTPSAPTSTSPVVVTKVTSPARRRYIARVDAVCRRLDRDRNSAEERVGAAADVAEATKAYDDGIAVGESEWREIKAIPAPPGEQQLIQTNVLDVIRRQLDLRRQIRTALAAEDVPRLEALRAELDNLTRSLVGFGRGYGFKVCGED